MHVGENILQGVDKKYIHRPLTKYTLSVSFTALLVRYACALVLVLEVVTKVTLALGILRLVPIYLVIHAIFVTCSSAK